MRKDTHLHAQRYRFTCALGNIIFKESNAFEIQDFFNNHRQKT